MFPCPRELRRCMYARGPQDTDLRVFLPFCFLRTTDGKHHVFVNGFASRKQISFHAQTCAFSRCSKIVKSNFENRSLEKSTGVERQGSGLGEHPHAEAGDLGELSNGLHPGRGFLPERPGRRRVVRGRPPEGQTRLIEVKLGAVFRVTHRKATHWPGLCVVHLRPLEALASFTMTS